jgi:hypothetical protein
MACLHVYNISGTTVLELDGEERKRLRCATHFGLALKETIQRLQLGTEGPRNTTKYHEYLQRFSKPAC